MSTSTKNSKDREFLARNSLLTDLFQNEHIRTVYNIFLAILIGLFANTAAHDYVEGKQIAFGLRLIKAGFGRIHVVALTWTGFLIVACCAFSCFKLWAGNRSFAKLRWVRLWDRFWLLLLVLYYVSSFQVTAFVVKLFELPIGSSGILTTEHVRFLMKFHAFVRSTSSRILQKEPHSNLVLPAFSHYFYFLFAPTLLYRDSYPRSEKTNWKSVLVKVLEFSATILFMSFIGERFLNPPLQEFALRKYKVSEIVLILFENTIAGILVLLTHFYIVLHVTQNFFAEIVRFGDRMFYANWWSSTDYGTYLRKWNVVVQDWLFVYIYRDFCKYVCASSLLAKLAVIFISAVVHEWILVHTLGFFFPLIFFEFFVLGTLLSCFNAPKNSFLNALFWYSLALGMSFLVTFYTVEYYARQNAPVVNPTVWDRVVPRFLTCDCFE